MDVPADFFAAAVGEGRVDFHEIGGVFGIDADDECGGHVIYVSGKTVVYLSVLCGLKECEGVEADEVYAVEIAEKVFLLVLLGLIPLVEMVAKAQAYFKMKVRLGLSD